MKLISVVIAMLTALTVMGLLLVALLMVQSSSGFMPIFIVLLLASGMTYIFVLKDVKTIWSPLWKSLKEKLSR